MTRPFDFLKTANDWLEKVPLRITRAFENFVGTGERTTQEKVDKICVWLAWKANIAIERLRQRLIRILYDQYKTTAGGKVMQAATAVQKFVSDPLGALGSFASTVFSPVGSIIAWSNMLLVELPRLAANLARIVQVLPPEPPSPNINYDKFKLKVGSISMAIITSDPSNLPTPESMFPEPEKPFSKNSFNKVFTESSANLKSNTVKYKLNEDDANSLKTLLEKETSTNLFDDMEIF